MVYQEEKAHEDEIKEGRFYFLRSVVKGTWFVEISIAFLIFLTFFMSKTFG